MTLLLRLACLVLFAGLLAVPTSAQTAEGPSVDTADGLAALDGSALAPATLRYANTVSMGSRSIDRPTTRTLARTTHDGTPAWQIVDAAQSGAQTDTLIVDRTSLRPLRRRVGGKASVRLTFDSTSVRGRLTMRGQTRDVQQNFDRPVLASTANMEVALAALPLEPGYTARLPVYQLQQQAVATTTVHVTGTDTVETPADTFETYVLKTTSNGPGPSGTIHVRRAAPHHVVQADLKITTGGRSVTATKTLRALSTDGASQTK
ncbi:MAG: hypothetical protein ABEL97_13495 [Salinibacter sp.]